MEDYPEFRRSKLLELRLGLADGERRTLPRTLDDVPEDARFFYVSSNGGGALQVLWLNRDVMKDPRAAVPYSTMPTLPLSSLAAPHFRLKGRFSKSRHLFMLGEVMLVSEPLRDCILALDPSEVEVRDIDIEGLPAGVRFYMMMTHRKIDPTDRARTRSKRPQGVEVATT